VGGIKTEETLVSELLPDNKGSSSKDVYILPQFIVVSNRLIENNSQKVEFTYYFRKKQGGY